MVDERLGGNSTLVTENPTAYRIEGIDPLLDINEEDFRCAYSWFS